MAQAAIDATAFPDQPTTKTSGLDPTAFPDQPDRTTPTAPPAPTLATKGVLGNPRKPASIRAGGGVLYDAIPTVTGATGGMLGGVVGTPAGPPGEFGGAVAGAGAGGIVGRYIQSLLQHTIGGTRVGDAFGVPSAPSSETAGKVAGQAGAEATTQMGMEATGRLFAAPLGFVRRGGFLRSNADVITTFRENERLGTKLSGPEIASGTPTGEISKTIQSYAAGAFGGGQIQRASRERGSAAAFKTIDDALALLGHPGMTGGPTATSRGSAYAARKFVGETIDQALEQSPPIDVRAVKDEAAQELQRTIVAHLSAVPDVAKPKLAETIRALRNNPTLIQRLPRPAMLEVADAIIEKHNSPTLSLLRRVVGMEDETPALGLWHELKSLRRTGSAPDALYAPNDVQRLSSTLYGQLRSAVTASAPQVSEALTQYRDLVRGDYLRNVIVLGNKPLPKTEADANAVLTSMGKRLAKAEATGRLAKQFTDPAGKQVIANLRQVSSLLEKRTPPMMGNLRKIFEIGRIVSAGMGLATGHATAGTAGAAVLWEGFPDFFTWVIHDPRATQWFIEGVSAPNPNTSSAAIIRLGELYRRTHQQQRGKPAAGDGSAQ